MQLSERLLIPGNEQSTDVLAHLQHKQQLMQAGDSAHEKIVPAVVLGAGGLRGAYQAGALGALHEHGLHHIIKYVVGGSVGSINGGFMIADQAPLGVRAYTEDLTSRDLINPLHGSEALKIDFLQDVITTKKPLDIDALLSSESELHIGVTNVATGEAEYIAAHTIPKETIIPTMMASASVPGAAQPREVHGTLYSDAITACKNPIEYALSLGATDVLCILNQPLRDKPTLTAWEKTIAQLATKSKVYSQAFRDAHMDRHTMSDETACKIYDSNVAVLCPETMPLKRLSINKRKSMLIQHMGYNMMRDLLL